MANLLTCSEVDIFEIVKLKPIIVFYNQTLPCFTVVSADDSKPFDLQCSYKFLCITLSFHFFHDLHEIS